jgi:hypothetical protein
MKYCKVPKVLPIPAGTLLLDVHSLVTLSIAF